jgi:hypothetical protein
MATAFTGTLVLKGASGKQQGEYFTNTDVTLAYNLWASQGSTGLLPVRESGQITDLILNIVALGDTKRLKLIIDGVDTGIQWTQAASFPTINNRFFVSNPVNIRAGQLIQIQAIT